MPFSWEPHILVAMKLNDAQKVQIFCAALSATGQTRNDGTGAKRGLYNDPVEEAVMLMNQAVGKLEAPEEPDTEPPDYRRPMVDI
jgi:hypothetical protein